MQQLPGTPTVQSSMTPLQSSSLPSHTSTPGHSRGSAQRAGAVPTTALAFARSIVVPVTAVTVYVPLSATGVAPTTMIESPRLTPAVVPLGSVSRSVPTTGRVMVAPAPCVDGTPYDTDEASGTLTPALVTSTVPEPTAVMTKAPLLPALAEPRTTSSSPIMFDVMPLTFDTRRVPATGAV